MGTTTEATTTTTTTTGTQGTTQEMSAGTSMTTATETGTPTSSTTGGPSGGVCAHMCSADADCLYFGMDVGLTCNDGRCSGGCSSDEECVPLLSEWETPCTAGGNECAFGQACVKAGSEGRCAGLYDPGVCSAFGFQKAEVEGIDGAKVTVCAQTRAECRNGTCVARCESNDHCEVFAPVCNVETGVCGCGSDEDCGGDENPHRSVCMSGVCGCPNDQACIDGKAGDMCNGGVCGCSGDAACESVKNPFNGGTISCVSQ